VKNKVIKSEQITDNKWLNLFKLKFKDKKGKEHDWYTVARTTDVLNKEGPQVVVIIPFLEDKMVLIKQYRPTLDDYIIEHPAGIIDKGETPLESAKRELKEETGLETIDTICFSDMLYNSPGITNESLTYVIAKVKGEPHTSNNEDTEDIEVLVVDQKEAGELLKSGVKFSAKCWLILQAFSANICCFDCQSPLLQRKGLES